MLLLGFHCTSYLPNTALTETSYSGRGWKQVMLCTGWISSVRYVGGLLNCMVFIYVFIGLYLFYCVIVSRLCYQCSHSSVHVERTGVNCSTADQQTRTYKDQHAISTNLITSRIPLIPLIRVSTSSTESSVINPCSRQLDKFI